MMAFSWILEPAPRWDDHKERIVGGAPDGAFPRDLRAGNVLPGTWWRVEDNGRAVGYGWMDVVWGEAEVLVAVDEGAQGGGVGSWILDRLGQEAAERGLNYIVNDIPESGPQRAQVVAWLQRRGFRRNDDATRLIARVRCPPQ